MLKRTGTSKGSSKVTFILPASIGPVSVVGSFNGWDPKAHPMRKRSNGTQSVAIDLGAEPAVFRYVTAGGDYFDEPDADRIEPNGFGQTHSVLART